MILTRSRANLVNLVLIAALLCLILTSCVREPLPTQEDITGTWAFNTSDSTYVPTKTSGTIQFQENGTFSLKEFPLKVILGSQSSSATTTTNENGTWEIIERQFGIDQPSIRVKTTGSQNIQEVTIFYFTTEGSGKSLRIVLTVGDPDDDLRYVLRKS